MRNVTIVLMAAYLFGQNPDPLPLPPPPKPAPVKPIPVPPQVDPVPLPPKPRRKPLAQIQTQTSAIPGEGVIVRSQGSIGDTLVWVINPETIMLPVIEEDGSKAAVVKIPSKNPESTYFITLVSIIGKGSDQKTFRIDVQGSPLKPVVITPPVVTPPVVTPPNVVTPPVVVPPGPPNFVTTQKLHVSVFYDPALRTREEMALLTDQTLSKYMQDKGHVFRLFNRNDKVDEEMNLSQFIEKDGVPTLIIQQDVTGTVLNHLKLPMSVGAILDEVRKVGG